MSKLKSLKIFLQENPALIYLLVFAVSFCLFLYLQLDYTLADPDSFYHAKMAVLIRDNGIIKDFPWLQFTTLKDNYVDHHFLYHVLLIPFVTFLDPLVGIKFSVVIFGSLAIIAFYWFLRKFKIKNALLYVILLLINSPFIIRANLAKTPMLSLIILILGLYFIFRKKYLGLLLLSFLYIWTYGGWPLIILILILYLLADFIKNILSQKKDFFQRIIQKVKTIYKNKIRCKTTINFLFSNFIKTIKDNWKLIASISAGLLLGLIINPYFPQTLSFYWDQTTKIAILDYGAKVGVGAEWYPYNGIQLFRGTVIIFILWLFSFFWYISQFKKRSTKSISLWIISIFFFLYTLKARRQVEYFIPFALFACAFSLNDFWSNIDWKKYGKKTKELFTNSHRFISALITTYLIILILFFLSNYVLACLKEVKSGLADGFSLNHLEKAGLWLKENTPKNSIVFNNNWDEFPILFYYNDHNYYIAGLAQNFMYSYDKKLCWQYTNLSRGNPPVDYEYKEKKKKIENEPGINKYNLADILKNNFNSSYIFISDRYSEKIRENIERVEGFEKVYQDEEGMVYKIL